MTLPGRFVENQGAHHAPAAPEALAKVLAGFGGSAPGFEAGGYDTGDHDDGMLGGYALGLGVEADLEGVVGYGVAFVFLSCQ